MSRGRRSRFVAVLALASLLGVLAASGPAAAHADFLTSTPAPYDIWNVAPTRVSVTVSEAVQPGSPLITVTDSNGTRVDTGPTTISPTDPATFSVPLRSGIGPSVYTVTWSVVSADDGHFTAGTFYFMIEYRDGTLPGTWPQTGTIAVSQPISPLDVGLEAASFIAFSAAFGAILLAALLWIPAGSGLDEPALRGPSEGLGALLQLGQIGALAFAGITAARMVENLASTPGAGLAAAFASPFLVSLLAQVAIALALVALLWRAHTRPPVPTPFVERPWELLPAIFLGFMLILLEVVVSHSATSSGWWPLAPIADAVHLYGAALWVGGLLAVFRVRPWLRDPTPPAFARAVLEGFSRFALLGVLLVVSAGLVLGVILIGSVDALFGTPYGWVVLGKGALLVPMVAVGAWNRRNLRSAEAEARGPAAAVRAVARNVRVEAAMGAAVLVLAGLLVTMNPAAAPQPLNPTFTLDATAGGLYAIFEMNPWPAAPGPYIFQLVVYFAGNQTAYYGGGNSTMSFRLEGGNGTWVPIAMEGPHGNHYVILNSNVLDAAGTWDIQAALRGPSGTMVDLSFAVSIHT